MLRDEQFTLYWTEAMPQVRVFVVALTGDVSLADDVLQEAAIALLRAFDDYDPKRPFLAWALQIAKFKAIDAMRKRSRSPVVFSNELVEKVGSAWEELLPELDQRTQSLQFCLSKLLPRAREMLQLRYERNQSPSKIAEQLGMSSVAVRVALNRARVVLRNCIDLRTRNGALS
jgi:RNA polymerase sigma-70 factor, ECF subfamily